VSRGIGRVQQQVIHELQRARGALLPRSELMQRLPREAEQRSLHRAVRGLLNRGLVYELHFGGRKCLALSVHGDERLRSMVDDSLWLLEKACRARGVPMPDLADPSWEKAVDTYRLGRKLSD
jgi:hypothetical protein